MRYPARYSTALALFLLMVQSALAADLKPFPEPEPGFTRHVVQLPAQVDESLYKVELFAGKPMEVDCNKHFFGGAFESRDIPGWGYSYLRIDSLHGPASTLMGCPDDKKRTEFVFAAPHMTAYNSRLPLVIYAAKDIEIRYRVWSSSAALQEAKVK